MGEKSVKGGYPGTKLVKNGQFFSQNENLYGSYSSHDWHVCQFRENSEMVYLRNVRDGQNSQNLKMSFLLKK